MIQSPKIPQLQLQRRLTLSDREENQNNQIACCFNSENSNNNHNKFDDYDFLSPQHLKWVRIDDIELPTLSDKICYYIKSIFNNDKNKLQYLEFKSRTYTLLNRSSYLLGIATDLQKYNEEQDYINIDEEIINIFQISDEYLKRNSKLLALSQVPFESFIENYIKKRDILLKLDNQYSDNFINDRYEMAMKTTYVINKIEILFEFVKTSVDKNDDSLFKIIVLIMNSLIILAEYAWKYYWVDGDKYGNN